MTASEEADLERLDEEEAEAFLRRLFAHLSEDDEYAIRHPDYTMEMPQSGERIRGRERMREFQRAYPNPPSIAIRRVLIRGPALDRRGVQRLRRRAGRPRGGHLRAVGR
jgi:hypothetical protein